jgi:transposase
MENPTSVELYSKLLEVASPWKVVRVEQDKSTKQIQVFIAYNDMGDGAACPICGCAGKIHDHRMRRLRHLDTCDYQTILCVRVPRMECPEHKVQQLPLGFAEKNSRYIVLFEGVVLDWLTRSPISGVSESFHLGWDAVDGIMRRAVERGLARRKRASPEAWAWRIKEQASMVWEYVYMGAAEGAWKKLLWWISHSRIPEMIKVGKTVRKYLWGILNAIRLGVTNSMLEAKNACIQRIKRTVCGFRNKERFKTAILFHLGNLDMPPPFNRKRL